MRAVQRTETGRWGPAGWGGGATFAGGAGSAALSQEPILVPGPNL